MKRSAQNLAKALFILTEESPHSHEKIINSFIAFCKKKHLAYLLPSFLKYFKIEAKRKEDTKTLKIFSAIKLSENTIKDIQKSAKAESPVSIDAVEDKNIVAGFIAYYQNRIIDASLKNNLRLLKNKLYEY